MAPPRGAVAPYERGDLVTCSVITRWIRIGRSLGNVGTTWIRIRGCTEPAPPQYISARLNRCTGYLVHKKTPPPPRTTVEPKA